MKHLFLIVLSFFILNLVTNAQAAAGSALKIEGSCSGNLADGTPVSFTYYSDFNGCKKVSKGAVTFINGIEGLFTGSRSFKGSSDYYNFPKHDITLANSTGNSSAKFGYRDASNVRHTVEVQCEVRDYEYGDCP
jgi:hypothetical protein